MSPIAHAHVVGSVDMVVCFFREACGTRGYVSFPCFRVHYVRRSLVL
jgi:hypothetical protein